MGVSHEEPLRDPLVHDDDRDLWLLTITVELGDSLLELGNFRCKHLVALGITNTVPVNDEVSRELLRVMLGKSLDSLSDHLFHTLFYNLLTLLLNKVVAIVLGHLSVDRRREANDALWTSMTHINADQHGPLAVQSFRELQVIKITTGLAVDLPQDVRSLREIKLEAVLCRDDLAWHPILLHHFFKLLVGSFSLEDADNYSRVTNLSARKHVLAKLLIKLFSVGLLRQLNPVGFFNS